MLFVFYYLAIWNSLLFKYLLNKVIEFCYANLSTPVNNGGLVMSSVQTFSVYSVVLFAEFFYSGPSSSKGA